MKKKPVIHQAFYYGPEVRPACGQTGLNQMTLNMHVTCKKCIQAYKPVKKKARK